MTGHERIATIIVLPPERQDELLALAREWTSSWMMNPAIWVRAQDVRPDDSVTPKAPWRLTGQVIARNGSAQVDVLVELGRQELDRVRVVAVRSVEADSAVNVELDGALDEVRTLLDEARPMRTVITYLNLICAPTYQDGASELHVVERGWAVNILASPEDRPTPGSFDVYTRHSDPDRWVGFMLAHTATAGGLWATMSEGPYDGVERSSFQEAITVQRIAVRGVLSGALVVNVALETLRRAAQDESALTDPLMNTDEGGLRIMSVEEEDEAVRAMVSRALTADGGRLAYRRPADPAPALRRSIGARAQFEEFARFAWEKVVDSPRWVVRRVKRRVSTRATDLLHGADGSSVVDVGGILSQDDLRFAREVERMEQARLAVAARLDEAVPVLRHDVDAQVWESIRQWAYAALDGSPAPGNERLSTRIAEGGGVPVVARTGVIIPDWRESWQPPESVAAELHRTQRIGVGPVAWSDLAETEEWLAALTRRIGRLDARDAQLRLRLGEVARELGETTQRLEDLEADLEAAEDEVGWRHEDLVDLQATVAEPRS
jgi:hypothetical protein